MIHVCCERRIFNCQRLIGTVPHYSVCLYCLWCSSAAASNSRLDVHSLALPTLLTAVGVDFQGLIEDVKLPVEPVLELEAGESMFLESEEQQHQQQQQQQQHQQQLQDKRDVKIKRTVVSSKRMTSATVCLLSMSEWRCQHCPKKGIGLGMSLLHADCSGRSNGVFSFPTRSGQGSSFRKLA